jgi:hypothetical protein
MTFKKQLKTIKENWILIVAVILVIIVVNGGASLTSTISDTSFSSKQGIYAEDSFYAPSAARGGYYGGSQDFAPEVEERLITINANMGIKTEHGDFTTAESQLKNIVSSTDSYLLSANANTYGEKGKEYQSGNYNIKVTADKYEAVTSQLQAIGEVTSYSESQTDITGTVTNLETDLKVEREKLRRYQEVYDSSENKEKVQLIDQIFYQERRIESLVESIANQGNRISYSTIYVTLSEEQPTFWNVQVVGFIELLKTLVKSFNSLLVLVFAVFPYAVAIGIIYYVRKFIKKQSNKKK